MKPYSKVTKGGQLRSATYYVAQPNPTPWRKSGYTKVDTWEDRLDGFELSDWKLRVKTHENATTPMTAVMRAVDVHGGSLGLRYLPTKAVYWAEGALLAGPNSTHFGTLDTALRTQAQLSAESKFASRYDSTVSAFQGGVFSGELRETIRSLRHPLSGLRKGLFDYHAEAKRNARRAANGRKVNVSSWSKTSREQQKAALGAIRDTWYEAVFGLQPMLSDIRDIAHALNRPMYVYTTISTRAKARSASVGPIQDVTWGSGFRSRTTSVARKFATHLCTGEVQSKNSASGRALDDFGIMPGQFLPTVWELIPYSWLVDYFTNLGDIVSAACRNYGQLSWFSGTNRCWADRQRVARLSVASNVNYQQVGSLPARDRWFLKEVVRSGTAPDIPPFEFTLPNTVKKLVNVAFLAPIRRL